MGNDMKDRNMDKKHIKSGGEFWRRFVSKIPGFCHGVDVVFALLGFYAAYGVANFFADVWASCVKVQKSENLEVCEAWMYDVWSVIRSKIPVLCCADIRYCPSKLRYTDTYPTFFGLFLQTKCFIKDVTNILNNSYNKSQQDAPFLNFILVKNSTCFGQTYCPSSGVLILYSQQ